MREEYWISRSEKLSEFDGLGMSFKQVANKVGLNEATVRRYSERFGLSIGSARGEVKPHKVVLNGTLEAIKECAALGKTRAQTAEELGITTQMVGQYAREYSVEFVHASAVALHDSARAKAMCAMYQGGKTLQEIGSLFGITRERVRQIIKKAGGLTAMSGGQHKKSIRRKISAAEKRDERCSAKYGCTYDQYRHLVEVGREMVASGVGVYSTPTRAWHSQRQNAKGRGIEWKISLWEWWQIWQDSGKWGERGRAGDKYVMCRFADDGNYEVDNVYISTLSHNSSFQPNNPYRKGHPLHEETMKRQSKRRPNHNHGRVTKKAHPWLPAGVTLQKRSGRYISQIGINGRIKYLGTFSTPELAHEAYMAALEGFRAGLAA